MQQDLFQSALEVEQQNKVLELMGTVEQSTDQLRRMEAQSEVIAILNNRPGLRSWFENQDIDFENFMNVWSQLQENESK